MNARHLLSLSFVLAAVAAAPMAAQSLTATPSRLYFVHQRPGNATLPPTQNIEFRGAPNVPVTISTTSPGGGGNWLLVIPTDTRTDAGGVLRVGVTTNPYTPVLDPGTYNGTITATPQTGTAATVNVQFVVSDSPLISANPVQLTFAFSRGAQLPAGRTMGIGATAANIGFTAAVTQIQGGDWLRIEPATGTAGTILQPTSTTVSIVNAANLAVGTYTATVTIVAPAAANNGVQVAVTLQVLDEVRLSANPAAVAFDFQIGGPNPADRTVFITSTIPGVAFTVELVRPNNQNWLNLSGSNTTFVTPATLTFTATPGTPPAGTYNSTIRIIAAGATNSPLEIPASLRVSTTPIISAIPAEGLRFSFQVGGAAPPRQAAVVVSSGANTSLTVDTTTANGGQWLNVAPGRTGTPSTLSVGVEPASLPAGTYTGNVRITGEFGNSPVLVPVTLLVTVGPTLRVADSNVQFTFQQGGTVPGNRTIAVTSTGAAVGVTTAVVSGGGWLTTSLSSPTTPSNLVLGVNPAGLPPGTYTGTVLLGPPDGGQPVQVIVRLFVSATTAMALNGNTLVFTHTVGRALPDSQPLPIGSTGTPINYTLANSTSDGTQWLITSRTTGTTGTPDTLVAVSPNNLAPGNYTGTIGVSSSVPNSPQYVPVLMNVLAQPQDLTVTPAALTFNQNLGAAAPASQTLAVRLSPDGRVAFNAIATTTAGINWLAVTPTEGITPGDLTVSVNPGALPAGTYVGTITINPINAPNIRQLIIPVTFNLVSIRPNLNLSRETLTFNFTPGTAAPTAQTVSVTSSGDPLGFTVTTQPQGSWLQATPGTGNTPTDLSISVNTTGLAPGTYNGTIAVASGNAANSPRAIAVQLVVAQPQSPSATLIEHQGTYQPAAAVPGLLVGVKGTNLGPGTPVQVPVVQNGLVTTTLGGVRVLFDGIPAPLLYVSATQINCVVPYGVANRVSTRVQVEYNGVLGNAIELRVADAAPGIFPLNQAGQGAIVNQDGSINGANTAAPLNTVLLIYATGDGSVSPAGIDGLVPTTVQQLRRPLLSVRVRIGGVEAEVEYAGSAPFVVSGVLQLNVRPGAGTPTGPAVPIDLIVGSIQSTVQRTVALR
jgi:uncharacterized protein (TIGR03437 family)